MEYVKKISVDSPLGLHMVDWEGSPVGVVRMDPQRSYAGMGQLLQEFIDRSEQAAWERIKAKIDFTYENLDLALTPLERETGFGKEVRKRVERGQRLLFKPNLVNMTNIDPLTHGPGPGSTACTEWAFVAALMRWFHDRLGVSYYQMCVGEAATTMSPIAGMYSLQHPQAGQVTTEAVIEGKWGDFYGGWGFYFARKYLAGSLAPSDSEDPMRGYQESVAGTYIPPGHVSDKLMVYDLNRIFDDPGKGRDIEVADGVNFRSITLHKAIVGGSPGDPEDLKAYPGCILVNVPKLKVHGITLFTNVIKNLGIGLYPMESAGEGGFKWDYSLPHTAMPAIKGAIPHQVWIPEMDTETGVPKRDASGRYVVKRTGGILATMADIIKAVMSQSILMLHVVDAIEAINHEHQGIGMGTRQPEGMVFAGLDAVATDWLCARYMFSNVPLKEALGVEVDDGTGGRFPQRVPVPAVQGKDIVTLAGYDCPLSRDLCFEYAEKRGLGERAYYVVGRDATAQTPLVSLKGHLGRVVDGGFSDLATDALYFDVFKMPWDMQRTAFGFMEAVDRLTGSSLMKAFLEAFDENGDGIVTYEEFGKKGRYGPLLFQMGASASMMGTEAFGYLRGPFLSGAMRLKWADAAWNQDGHDLLEDSRYAMTCLMAYRMSQMPMEAQDPFHPSLTWGKGKWPSYQLASYVYIGVSIYGGEYPMRVGFPSLYGYALRYADLTQNQGRYTGSIPTRPDIEGLQRYFTDVTNARVEPLDFTMYVPAGYDNLSGSSVPNVEVADDPGRIFTARFAGGRELWRDSRI